jgi:cytochrome P450
MFSSRRLNEHMLEVFVKHTAKVLARLESVAGTFKPIDMQNLFHEFTLDSICSIAFGVDLNSLDAEEQPAFAKAFDATQMILTKRWFVPPMVWKTMRFFRLGPEGQLVRHLKVLNEFVYAVIRARRQNLAAFADSGDLLSLFLQDAEKRKEELSDAALKDIILNFLIAGRDTTASALTYLFKSLSERPEIEERIADELHRELGADDGSPEGCGVHDEATARKLVYLEATFMETTRLYAPVAGDLKFCIADCVFPGGTKIPAGTVLGYSPYTLNRMESVWGKDACEFRPERWIDEQTGHVIQPPPAKFPSFNAGPRLCLVSSLGGGGRGRVAQQQSE